MVVALDISDSRSHNRSRTYRGAAVIKQELRVSVQETLFEQGKQEIHFFQRNGRRNYRVTLSIEGRDVPYISHVDYYLHKSFGAGSLNSIERTVYNQNCALHFWTWGTFEVVLLIHDKVGNTYELSYQLAYPEQFKLKGVLFKERKPQRRKWAQLKKPNPNTVAEEAN